MSRAIDDLKHEHDAILVALKILDGIERRLAAGQPVDGSDLEAFIGFLKEFADRCHHGKEEDILFPAMVAAGMPEQASPIEALLREHTEGRAWIRRMESGVHPTLNAAAFVEAARGYAGLLRSHIGMENDVLFPMAERALSVAQLDRLFEAFEEHEAKVIGAGRHEQLHELLKGLGAKYSAQR